MDRINNIKEGGGAGDWGTGQEIERKKKLKTFKEFKDQETK